MTTQRELIRLVVNPEGMSSLRDQWRKVVSRGSMAMSESPDAHSLAARACLGDRQAWAAIVDLCMGDVWRMSVYFLGDEEAAKDVVQDTFLKAQRGLSQFRGEGELTSWIQSICLNCCRTEWRRLQRRRAKEISIAGTRPSEGDKEAVPIECTTAAFEDERVRWMDLQMALEILTKEEQEAFILVKGLGHTSQGAAQLTGVPASTIRSRVTRAREKLVLRLEGYGSLD